MKGQRKLYAHRMKLASKAALFERDYDDEINWWSNNEILNKFIHLHSDTRKELKLLLKKIYYVGLF